MLSCCGPDDGLSRQQLRFIHTREVHAQALAEQGRRWTLASHRLEMRQVWLDAGAAAELFPILGGVERGRAAGAGRRRMPPENAMESKTCRKSFVESPNLLYFKWGWVWRAGRRWMLGRIPPISANRSFDKNE